MKMNGKKLSKMEVLLNFFFYKMNSSLRSYAKILIIFTGMYYILSTVNMYVS